MTALTPITAVQWHGSAVFARDTAGYLTLLAVAVSGESAEWLAWSIGRAHKVPHELLGELPSPASDAPGSDVEGGRE